MSDLVKRLRIKAGMIEMGEMIAWGSDSALMREAADALEMTAPDAQGEPDVGALVEALESIMRYIPLDVVHCRGDKCRELWCASCFGEEAESYLVTAARHLKNAKSALAAHRKGGEK